MKHFANFFFYKEIFNYFFLLFLCVNLLCYGISFIIIVVFALILLVGFIRGDHEFVDLRSGLS
jgi:hypothetical protein